MEVFSIAHDRVVNGRTDLLIVILKEKINVEKLPADLRPYISKSTHLCLLKCSLNTTEMKIQRDLVLIFSFKSFKCIYLLLFSYW